LWSLRSQRHMMNVSGTKPVDDFLRDGRFAHLPEPDRRDLLRLMARISEQAYRRGVQQALTLSAKGLPMPFDLWSWRYGVSLDQSPELHGRRIESRERLEMENHGLPRVGLFVKRERPA
jgi:hypothetical protein